MAIAVAVGSLSPAPAIADASPMDLYRRVEAALGAWHPERAVPIVAALESYDEEPLSHLAAARLAFHQGRFADGVAALDRMEALAGSLPTYAGFSSLLRNTHQRTQQFVSQRSEHFEVYAAPGPDELLMPFVLETLEAALAAIGGDLGIELPEAALPIRVDIYPDIDDFVAVSTLSRDEVETSGTVALCKFHRLMIVSPRRLVKGYRWRDTLAHELVHLLLSRGTDNGLPLWLHEGVAKYEERRWRSPELGKLHPIQASILAEARERDVYVPFRDMMPSLAKLDSGWQTSLAFAEVTLLVGHIVEDGGMPALRRIIEAFSESQQAGFAALGVPDEDALWDRFSKRLKTTPLNPVPGYRFIPPKVSEDPDEAEPEPIEQASARKYARIGDLLRDEGRWAAAVTEYAKAQKMLGYKPAPLSLRLAEALMIGGEYTRAEAELRQLLRRAPDRATAHWLLGKIALFRGDAIDALESYERAFAIAPFHDEVLDGLVVAAERSGAHDKLESYQRAKEIWHARTNRP